MSRELVVKGSIQSVASGGDVALAMLDAKLLLICDISGSMQETTSSGLSKFQILKNITKKLQERHPGQVVVESFSDDAELNLDGVLPEPNGGTSMVAALEMASPMLEAGIVGVLMSDGEPTDGHDNVLSVARSISGKINPVFIGQEGSPGADFMRQLAKEIGTECRINDIALDDALLESTLTTLLLEAGGR